jgi:hypothetical protein
MLEELRRRNYAESTIQIYIQTVEHFSRHFHRSPGGVHGFVRAKVGTFTTFDPPGSEEPSSLTIADGSTPGG